MRKVAVQNNIISHPSSNFGDRPEGCPIDILVLHYTGMKSGKEALERLSDPESSVSSHYLIEEDGSILLLVDEDKRAWHAGRGCWQGCSDVNSHSIGVEIVNPGHEFGYRPFPDVQIQSVIALCQDILSRFDIPPERVIAHSDMAPDRKEDPGELFPWKLLAENGIGIWPQDDELAHATQTPADQNPDAFDQLLAKIGYSLGDESNSTQRAIAFQRHWRPADISGVADTQCFRIARSLANQINR